jgi:hypothetical protein
MNNSTIFTADRTTHLKIVVISLVASIAVMVVGITTRVGSPDTTAHVASGPAIKAGKPIAVTNAGVTTIR